MHQSLTSAGISTITFPPVMLAGWFVSSGEYTNPAWSTNEMNSAFEGGSGSYTTWNDEWMEFPAGSEELTVKRLAAPL